MSEFPTQTTAPPTTEPAPARRGPFFNARDKLAFAIATGVTFVGYVWTLAPSVTLEDSGEFITAAHNLGVPHPPGYPIWTILAWVWQWIIPFGNIAWRENLMSAFFGALAVGLTALLISRSGREIAATVGFLRAIGNEELVGLIVLASSVSAALMLAFTPVLWSQAVITEVYALNAFFLLVTLVLLYRWSFEPDRRWRLYLAAFTWGLGLTSHQTQVLLVIAFPLFILFVDRRFGRDVLLPILIVVLFSSLVSAGWIEKAFHGRTAPGLGLLLAVMRLVPSIGALFKQPSEPFTGVCGLLVAGATGWWLYRLVREGPGWMRTWRQVITLYVAVALGLSLYAYMPLSSATNPPMNWGYTRTPQGFVHHFTRGQYEKLQTERSLVQGEHGLWGQLNMFFDDLRSQFSIMFALAALVALFFYRDLADRERDWLKFLLAAFLFLSVGFIYLSNPTFEKQKLFTNRVFFLPAHCLYAFWIGHGMILGLGYVLTEKPKLQKAAAGLAGLAVVAGAGYLLSHKSNLLAGAVMLGSLAAIVGYCHLLPHSLVPALGWRKSIGLTAGLVALLPVASLVSNWADNEQRNHDFGYRFGYSMFKPGGEYPDMDQDAVLYGGTDPGRFVPTYMIFVESQVPPRAKTHLKKFPDSGTFDRRDVYIITQNALADGTYMNYIRDHYDSGRPDWNHPDTLRGRSGWQRWLFGFGWHYLGRSYAYPKEPIWIPNETDTQQAFAVYVQELQTRAPLPGEEVKVENGRVSVQGVQGVMAINAILTRMIFEKNKDKHTFYVEESFAIPWMYPYLEPYGIILKLNKEPLAQLEPALVARDRRYWDALAHELLSQPEFKRDDMAQKTFAKLRSAIGGLYAARRMASEAEYAYRQAIELCPESPEGNFRLAQLYMEIGRFDNATALLDQYEKRDPYNVKIREAINTIQEMRKQIEKERELKEQFAAQPDNLTVALQLVGLYAQRQQMNELDALVNALAARPDLSSRDFLQLANLYVQLRRLDRCAELLTRFTQRFPQDPVGWYNLAFMRSSLRQCDEALAALERAFALDAAAGQARNTARQDPRFSNCRNDPRFQLLVGQGTLSASPGGFTITH